MPADKRRWTLHPVTALRIGIIVAVLAGWEALSMSGLLYRDVVPSLQAIGWALYETLADKTSIGTSTRPSMKSAGGL